MKALVKKALIKLYFGNSFFRKGVCFGKDSYIRENAQIGGGSHIILGEHTRISPYSRLMCFEKISGERLNPTLSIGDNCFIGRNCTISCSEHIEIGNDCLITGYVFICDSEHGMNPEYGERYEKQPMIRKNTKIGNNVFIGEKAMIMPGVSIGDNCIIGAGSVVKKSFPNDCMIVGNPARCVKKYNYETHNWEKVNHE